MANAQNVAKVGDTECSTLQAAFDAAEDGATIQVIKAGEYAIPAITKNLKIEATVEGVVVKHEANSAITTIASDKTATFKNITFNLGTLQKPTAHGFGTLSGSNGALVMDGCTINGALNLFGKSTFTNCKFNAEGIYNIWAVNDNATFTDCTFTNTNRAVNVYDQKKSSTTKNVSFSNCTFAGSALKKAAVNIHHNPDPVGAAAKYAVSITKCTTSGTWASTVEETGEPVEKTICYSPLWMISDIVNWEDGDITVTVDGKAQDVSKFSPVAKIGDTKYTSLEAAAEAAKSGETIVLLADIDLGENAANINKAVTIEGDGHTISSTATQAIAISGSGNVTINNTVVSAKNRGINVSGASTGFTLNVNNSTIQSQVDDPMTTYTIGDHARGINIANADGVTLNITNSTIQGFSYDINIPASGTNLTVNVTGGKTYGRDIVNNWGSNNTFNLNGVEVHGLNNQTGPTEAFSCIVENTNAQNNNYTIQDCQFIATLSDAAMSAEGSTATEQMIDLRGTNSTVKVLGSTTYTCNSNERGGLVYNEGALFTNKLYFDDTTKATFADAFKEAVIADEKDAEVGLYPVTYTPEVYYYWIADGKEEGGYYHFAEPFTKGWLADGEFIQLMKDVSLTEDVACQLESGASFTLTLGDYKVTKGNFSVSLKPGVTVYTDKSASIFSAAEEGYVVKSTKSDNGYTYTVEEADLMFTDANGKVSYKEFSSSVISANGTYKLLKDVTATARIAPTIMPTNIIVDLNGHTLTSTAADYGFLLSRNGTEAKPKTFELVDNSEEKGGKLIVNAEANAAIQVQGKYNEVTIGKGVTVENGCVAILSENDKLTVAGTIIGGDDFAVATNGSKTKNANITIKEGAVLTSNETAMYLPGYEGLVANVEGGSITGAKTGIEVRAGQLTVNGGTISTTAGEYSYTPNGNGTTTKGAAIAVVQHTTVLPTDVQVLGGTLEGTKTIAVVDAQSNNLKGVTVKAKDELVAKKTEIPAGFKWVSADGMSTLTPCDYVAQIGEGENIVKYETLAEAVAAATAETTTITLLTDVKEGIEVKDGKNIVLDLNGKTMTGGIDQYDADIVVKNGTLAGTVYVNGAAENTENYNKFTLDATATIIAKDYGIILWQSDNNTAYGSTIDINGTINGCVFVMGNIKEGNSVINVNDGATIKGEVGIALNGYATLNVVDGATIEGTVDSGIEVRAGKLNVTGGKISSTASKYTVNPNGSGTTTTGAAIAVAQHTTKLATDVVISGGELSGVKTISVADPQNNNLERVTVKVADALANVETVVIPEGYKWVSADGMSTLTKKEYVAQIGEGENIVKYESLADAVAAATADATTITLLKDVKEGIVVKDGKNIVLDLNGNTMTGGTRIDNGYLTVNNGTLAGTVNIYGSATEVESYNGFTVDANATIASSWGIILREASGSNAAYGTTININGSVIGTAWVMGNIHEGNSVINVNSGAKIEGSVFGLNGYATLNVNEGATIIGSETGIEVRAGKLNVIGGTITSTASEYTVVPSGSGTTTTGAAIAVAQHTTGLATEVKISGGEFAGVKSLAIVNPQYNTAENVKVAVSGGKFNGDLEVSDTRVTKFVSGGVFTAEVAEEYCAAGYVCVDNADATYKYTVQTKEEAGIFVLYDKEPYKYVDEMPASEVTYVRSFGTKNFQSWYVPFDYTITEEDANNFLFYKIHMIAASGDQHGGNVYDNTKVYIYIEPLAAGTLMKANRPYVIQAKNPVQNYTFIAKDIDKLYKPDDTSRLHNETTEFTYDFYGTYKSVFCDDDLHWIAISGGNACPLKANTELKQYRWYIKIAAKQYHDDYAKLNFIFVEGDGETNGISAQTIDGEIQGIYTLGGVKVEHPVKGVNIIKYTDGRTKKINVK